MNKLLFTGFFLLLTHIVPAQNLIGRKASEIRGYMRTNQKEFSLDESTVNKTYKYLKYVDVMETQTALYFLSKDDRCTWYKVIYDKSLLSSVVAKLDSTCKKLSDTSWVEETEGRTYKKILKQEDWFFSVTTKPEEQDSLNIIVK